MTVTRTTSGARRREAILEAALTCFLERGFAATTIADIRQASGATTGSIYHFFAGKGALAEALLGQAVAGWSAASGASDADASAEEAIKGSIRGLLRWGLANPRHLRFMEEIRTRTGLGGEFAEVRRMLDAGFAAAADRFEAWARAGAVRTLPFPLAQSLMAGPAYNYLRLMAAGHPSRPEDIDELVEAAWAVVKP